MLNLCYVKPVCYIDCETDFLFTSSSLFPQSIYHISIILNISSASHNWIQKISPMGKSTVIQ